MLPGPGNTEWELQIKDEPNWVTLVFDLVYTIKMSPSESDAGKVFTFTLVLKEKGSGGVSMEWPMTITVGSKVSLTYEVTMTDVETGKGQIRFNLPVNLQWLKLNFATFFAAKQIDSARPAGELTTLTADAYADVYAGQTVDISVDPFDPRKVDLEISVVAFASEYGKVGGLYLTHE